MTITAPAAIDTPDLALVTICAALITCGHTPVEAARIIRLADRALWATDGRMCHCDTCQAVTA